MAIDPRVIVTQSITDGATAVIDAILARWDDEDYQDQLGHLDDVIDEQIDWLASTVEEKVSLTMSDVRQIAQDLRAAVAAVRNADQQRTDNNTRAGAR
jgi:non-homologous end joining protein Ku